MSMSFRMNYTKINSVEENPADSNKLGGSSAVQSDRSAATAVGLTNHATVGLIPPRIDF